MKKRKLSVNEFFYDNSFEEYTILTHFGNGRIYHEETFQQLMAEYNQRLTEFRQNLDAHRTNIYNLQQSLNNI